MYHVSAQGVDEHMINVHYYYYVIHICVISLSCVCVRLTRDGSVMNIAGWLAGGGWVGGVNSCESLTVLLHKSGGPS